VTGDRRWIAAALLLLIAAVFWQSYDGRRELRAAAVRDCQLNQAGRLDAIGRDRDLVDFARRASVARAADGDLLVAQEYERIASRAEDRIGRTRLRRAEAGPCEQAIPSPSPLPSRPF
jgi:hypothetical protein